MSTATPIYVLDANVFIQAHRRHYTFAICPGFWNSILYLHNAGRVVSVDHVRNEILVGDELGAWVKNKAPTSLFASTSNDAVANQFAAMMQWVQTQTQFKAEAKAEFAQVADGWVAAYAKAHSGVVVTHEEYRPDAKNRVPLPNVCKQFGVTYADTFAMLKDLKVRFDWSA